MRILTETPGSVLWLMRDNNLSERNLRKEAERRGVDPNRIVFASHKPTGQHLARLKNADIVLDTLPYNAHTTASDALWVDVPVLSCPGQSFAARVAGSLLYAVGLPELVAKDLDDYEALAIKLATQPKTLAEIRDKIAAGKLTAPLFDCPRFTGNLESAYFRMWQNWKSGRSTSDISDLEETEYAKSADLID
jgi:predicted O-linked N-acetylglucosamine transferase (SPINDLY family)